jgi:hypothetical protein
MSYETNCHNGQRYLLELISTYSTVLSTDNILLCIREELEHPSHSGNKVTNIHVENNYGGITLSRLPVHYVGHLIFITEQKCFESWEPYEREHAKYTTDLQ